MSIKPDHVHVLALASPKISISDYCGIVKGRTAILVFNKYQDLKDKPYWSNHFWTESYCVDTVVLDSERIESTSRIRRPKSVEPKNSANCFRAPTGGNSIPPL